MEEMRESLKTLGRLVEMEEAFDGGEDMNEVLGKLGEIFGEERFEIRWPVVLVLARKRVIGAEIA